MEQILQKVALAMQEDFVGNITFSDAELSKMFDCTCNLLRDYDFGWGNSISHSNDPLVFVAMVNAVKTWKSDEDTFWDYIYKKLMGTAGSQKVYVYLTSVIARLGKAGKIMYLSGCTKRYYATILAHAFAPLNSSESFLELCWNLYSEDMSFTYNKNDDIFTLVAEELKRTFLNEESLEDDFRLGSGVYSLRAGIKRMAIDSPVKMVQHIETTVSLLDRAFSGEILDNYPYYNSIVRCWWAEKEKSFGVEKPKRVTRDRAITDYSTIRPKYSFNGKQAVLTIPSIRLKNNFYVPPILNIYKGEELVDQRKLDTFGTGLTMATKELSIYADDLLSGSGTIDCSLEIIHCDESIYNSKKALYRDYLLFKDSREIIQEECFPGNYTLFAPLFDRFTFYPKSIKRKPGEPNLFVFNALEGEILQNKKRTIFFVNDKQNRSIKFISDKKNNAKFVHDGEEYIVIDGELKVVVNADLDVSKYGIRYEASDFRLKDFTCISSEDIKIYLITELLNVCEPQRITVFSYTDNKIEASFNVVKFNTISITYDKTLYFDNECTGNVRFLTEKYDRTVSVDINKGDIVIPFDDGDIVLTPPILLWRIDDGKPSSQYGESLWYKTFSNSSLLYLDIPPELGYRVFVSNTDCLVEGSELNSYKLGEQVYSMLQKTDELTVFVRIENSSIVYPVMNVCLKEKFRMTPIIIKAEELIWNPKDSFVGDDNAQFCVSVLAEDLSRPKENKTKISATLNKNSTPRTFSLSELEYGHYTVKVDLIKTIAFSKKTICLYEQEFDYGSKLLIKWKKGNIQKIRISNVILENGETKKQESFFVDNLTFIEEQDGYPVLSGKIYRFFYGQKIGCETMKDDNNNAVCISPIYCKILSDDICELAYKKYFTPDSKSFFWKSCCMISLNSFKREKIKQFVFVE